MFVRDWMSAPAITLGPDATASAALAFLEKRKIRRVPVVEDGKLVGIVTKSDLLGAGKNHAVHGVTTVANVMTKKPFTVQQDDTLEAAAQLMLGIGERGARVLMTVRDDADLLQNIRGRLNGLSVRSLVTVHDPSRNVWEVVMRVRGRAAAKVS